MCYALQNVSMILLAGEESQGPKWVSFDGVGMPEKASEFLGDLTDNIDLSEIGVSCVNICGSLLHVDPGLERQNYSTIPDIKRDTRNGDSMLAVRSPSWSVACPRFCLFVLLEGNHDDEGVLYELPEKAISLKNYYGEGDCRFSPSDWKILRGWRRALKDRVELLPLI